MKETSKTSILIGIVLGGTFLLTDMDIVKAIINNQQMTSNDKWFGWSMIILCFSFLLNLPKLFKLLPIGYLLYANTLAMFQLIKMTLTKPSMLFGTYFDLLLTTSLLALTFLHMFLGILRMHRLNDKSVNHLIWAVLLSSLRVFVYLTVYPLYMYVFTTIRPPLMYVVIEIIAALGFAVFTWLLYSWALASLNGSGTKGDNMTLTISKTN